MTWDELKFKPEDSTFELQYSVEHGMAFSNSATRTKETTIIKLITIEEANKLLQEKLDKLEVFRSNSAQTVWTKDSVYPSEPEKFIGKVVDIKKIK